MRRWPAFLFILAALVGAVSCERTPASDAVVEQLRIKLVVQADGSVDVTETLTIRAFAPPSPFARELRRTRVDGFVDVRAVAADAATDPSAALIDVDRWGDVRVQWPDVSGESGRTIQLHYRMLGALEVHGTQAWLQHRVLPLEPAYPVADAAVELELPPAARIIEPPAIAGPGWTLVGTPSGATATRSGITPREGAVVSAALDVRAMTILLPAWQQNADRAREMAPAFLIGAFFILVTGVGAVIMVRVQYPRRRTVAGVRSSARQVATGLVATGTLVLALGVASWIGAMFVIERYGRSVAAVPVSMVIVGLVMLGSGLQLRRRAALQVDRSRPGGNPGTQ